jgi:hypothetical protein
VRNGLRAGLVVWTLVVWTLGLAAHPGYALPASVDADQDDVLDTLESALGADPGDPTSTPESEARPATCLDGLDNDADGATDAADDGCHLPGPSGESFPPAGDDVFEASLTFRRFPLDTPFGICSISVSARGPVVVHRSDPGAGVVGTEVVALQLDGTGEFHAEPGLPGCLVPPGTFDLTLFEDPLQASTGTLTDDNPDPSLDFPAIGVFDLYFQIAWGFEKKTVLPGGPREGPAGAPLHLENRIRMLPGHIGPNAGCWASSNDELCAMPPAGSYLCYEGRFFVPERPESVDVTNDLEPQTTEHRVRKPALFCAPASHDGRPVYDPIGHLACFKLAPKRIGAPLFWKSKLWCRSTKRLQEGLSLELPTLLDDYVCYRDADTDRFGAPFQRRPIVVTDAFGSVATEAIAPKLHCSPSSSDGLQSPPRSLECFKLAPRRVRQTAELFDRSGRFVEQVTTSRAVSLCVPASWEKTALD